MMYTMNRTYFKRTAHRIRDVHPQNYHHHCDTAFPSPPAAVPAPNPGKQVCFLSLWFLPFLEFRMGAVMHLALCL